MTEATKSLPKARPTSPHVQIWRWHVTMASSILHRVTGVGNTVSLILLLAWIGSLAAGPEAYDVFTGLIGSFIGQVVVAGCLIFMAYHIVNGIRHLLFNLGIGLTKEVASQTAWAAIILGVVLGVLMYVFGFWALGK